MNCSGLGWIIQLNILIPKSQTTPKDVSQKLNHKPIPTGVYNQHIIGCTDLKMHLVTPSTTVDVVVMLDL